MSSTNNVVFSTENICVQCDKPLADSGSLSWWLSQGPTCGACIRRNGKLKRHKKHKKQGLQHSKPLLPGGYGYAFRPDKMPAPSDKYMFTTSSRSEVSGRLIWDERKKWNERIYERKYRKQQRRVDQYYIDQQLEEMEYAVARED